VPPGSPCASLILKLRENGQQSRAKAVSFLPWAGRDQDPGNMRRPAVVRRKALAPDPTPLWIAWPIIVRAVKEFNASVMVLSLWNSGALHSLYDYAAVHTDRQTYKRVPCHE